MAVWFAAVVSFGFIGVACGDDPGVDKPAGPPPPGASPESGLNNVYYPQIRSYCDPDRPGVRIYVSAVLDHPDFNQGAGGGGVAVIAGQFADC